MIFNWIYGILLTTCQFFYLHVIKDMDDPWFNVIFNKDFDDDYDNVMNNIVDRINYPNCEGNGASVAIAGDDDDVNDNDDDDVDSNDDGNDGDDESDDDGEFFF
jgi:hypothetical protein